nr:MAG TPA: hypothetical protein [Caudoviricetes sp.]
MEKYLQFVLQICIFIWECPEKGIIFLNICC